MLYFGGVECFIFEIVFVLVVVGYWVIVVFVGGCLVELLLVSGVEYFMLDIGCKLLLIF